MNTVRLILPVLVCTLVRLAPSTQAADFSIAWHSIDAGPAAPGVSHGGNYELSGTLGQPDAGPALSGGTFTIAGGFRPDAASGSAACAGDFNCDGAVDFDDINPFVLRLTDEAAYGSQFPTCPAANGDLSGDGQVDFDDINPFVSLLLSSDTPVPCP